MRTKNKTLTLLEIAIVLCSVFLVALPVIAAEQTTQEVSAITTASEDDYTLDIYGNANEDDTIDMRDLTYVKLIFFGKKSVTELADAKYDGKINPLDFIQIKLIIVGKEKEITVVDSADRIVTVKKPVERIVEFNRGALDTMRSLNLEKDKIVGVDKYTIEDEIFYPEFSDYPSVESYYYPDIEKALALEPDTVFLYVNPSPAGIEDKLKTADPDITVLRFNCYILGDIYIDEIKKIGYVIGKVEEADNFIEFYGGVLNTIQERRKDIPLDERPKVYFEIYRPYHTCGSGLYEALEMAGGNNIFSELTGPGSPEVDKEAVVERDPEIIVRYVFTEGGYDTDDITELSNIRDEIMGRSELAKVIAVKSGCVYIINNDVIGGTNNFIGVAYMAKWFHPRLFEDLDPHAIHREYIAEFQGLDLDLDEHGVFVYHPVYHPDGR